MIIIGLVLLGLAIAAGIDLVAQNRTSTLHIHAVGQTFSATPGWLIAFGAACALVAAVGIMLLHDGGERRRQARAATRSQRDKLVAQVQQERDARIDAEHAKAAASAEAEAQAARADACAAPVAVTGSAQSHIAGLRDGSVATPQAGSLNVGS